jgi:hypothetical protein
MDFTILSFIHGILFSLLVLIVGSTKRFVFSREIKFFIFLEFLLLFIPFIISDKMKMISLIILNGHLLLGLLVLIFIYRQKLSLNMLTEKYIQKKLKNYPAISEMVIGEIQAIMPILVLAVFAGLGWGIYYSIQWVINP